MGTNSRSASTVESEDAVQVPINNDAAMCVVSVKGLKENWQRWSSEHQDHQKHNPFSAGTHQQLEVPQKGQEDYGRPRRGSMTEQRGQDAHSHISREIQELCEVIRTIGEPKDIGRDGCTSNKVFAVEFGKLFDQYVDISNKLVGILLRARKQKLVDFEGEMLWQGKDDHVVITLTNSFHN